MKSRTNPPMGWNSFDCFGATVTEAEVLANAQFLATHLKPYGWDHVVVDYCWSHPSPPACTNPNQFPEFQPYLTMDADFRLQPAVERFPSAAGGVGFRSLADQIHALGLQFGIHIMRGIPRQATYPGYPALTLRHRAIEIADTEDTCPWLNHMFGIRPGSAGGQDYYDSLFELYAQWGVDFVKADDLCFPYRAGEIEMIDLARKRAGREIKLSLSPGPCPTIQASHVARHADLWRMSADFWDDWVKLKEMFRLCAQWAPLRGMAGWPDADMLPLGRISKRGPVGPEHDSFFTPAEQRTMITLWCLFGSPLFIGGNLTEMDEATLQLLTNPQVLQLQASGCNASPTDSSEYPDTWLAVNDSATQWTAGFFNLSDVRLRRVIRRADLGLPASPVRVRDLWQKCDLPMEGDCVAIEMEPHGCRLLSFEYINP